MNGLSGNQIQESGFQIKVLRRLQTIYDLIISSPPGTVVWGNIIGTLSDQDDLQDALDAKFNNPTGTISEYIRGDGTLATFPTTSSVGFEQNFLLMGA
jgi:hypothetical protein